jgi:hypothetical protein
LRSGLCALFSHEVAPCQLRCTAYGTSWKAKRGKSGPANGAPSVRPCPGGRPKCWPSRTTWRLAVEAARRAPCLAVSKVYLQSQSLHRNELPLGTPPRWSGGDFLPIRDCPNRPGHDTLLGGSGDRCSLLLTVEMAQKNPSPFRHRTSSLPVGPIDGSAAPINSRTTTLRVPPSCRSRDAPSRSHGRCCCLSRAGSAPPTDFQPACYPRKRNVLRSMSKRHRSHQLLTERGSSRRLVSTNIWT